MGQSAASMEPKGWGIIRWCRRTGSQDSGICGYSNDNPQRLITEYPYGIHPDSTRNRDLVCKNWPIGQPKQDWDYILYEILLMKKSLNGKILQLNSETKYFRVTLDGKFSWRTHLEKRCQRCAATMCQLMRAMESSWDLEPLTLVWTYDFIVKPMLTYAAVALSKIINKETAEAALEIMRKPVLRGNCG